MINFQFYSLQKMALVNLMRKVSVTSSLSPFASQLLCQSMTASNDLVPSRNYIKNFFNEKTAIKPHRGWMHENRGVGPGNRTKKLQIKIPHYSEIHRQRRYSYEARMKTEGGRKTIMRRILMGRDHLSG